MKLEVNTYFYFEVRNSVLKILNFTVLEHIYGGFPDTEINRNNWPHEKNQVYGTLWQQLWPMYLLL